MYYLCYLHFLFAHIMHLFIDICFYRLKESDKKTVFSVLKKSERDKKKLLETVLKQLRQLAQTTQQQ